MDAVSKFVLDVLERAAKSSAQFTLATMGGERIFLHSGFQWAPLGYAAASGFILSVLTSIASQQIGNKASASALPVKEVDLSK